METESPFEKGPERIPTREEVMAIILRVEREVIFVRELRDVDGELYLLEVRTPDKSPGEYSEYLYVRKRRSPGWPDGTISTGTVILVTFYKNDIPCGGNNIADYNPETGEWVF